MDNRTKKKTYIALNYVLKKVGKNVCGMCRHYLKRDFKKKKLLRLKLSECHESKISLLCDVIINCDVIIMCDVKETNRIPKWFNYRNASFKRSQSFITQKVCN